MRVLLLVGLIVGKSLLDLQVLLFLQRWAPRGLLQDSKREMVP